MTHRKNTRTKIVGVLTAATLFASACSGSSDEDASKNVQNIDASEIQLTSGLETFDSCDALLETIQTEALKHVGPYGFNQPGQYFEGIDDAMIDAEEGDFATTTMSDMASDEQFTAKAVESAPSAVAPQAGEDFSETNNQEQGVDEADLVKTDGKRILVLSNQKLYIIDAETNTRLHTIKVPSTYQQSELFLNGDTAYIMSQGYAESDLEELDNIASTRPFGYANEPVTSLAQIDLIDGELKENTKIPGTYLSARAVDGTIRLVMSNPTLAFDFVQPTRSGERSEQVAENANRDLINASVIEDWLPNLENIDKDIDCDNVHVPKEFAGFGLLSILTIDAQNDFEISDTLAIFTNAKDIYASTDRLVIATPKWVDTTREIGDEPVDIEPTYETALHTFDISDTSSTIYKASGLVKGSLLNRYSLSEHEGTLRVATTVGSPWSRRNTSESFVTTFAEEDGALIQLGQVGEIGKGEDIFAVRFLGETGYVVTFKQTDPFYTVDLSNPEKPEVLGELKIPGFSTYLHPVDEDTVLGVGMDGDERGSTEQAVVSLFDVSDLENPTRTDKFTLSDSRYSYTPVDHDPRSFTFWDSTALVPVGAEGEEGQESELVLVEISGDSLKESGRISHEEKKDCPEFERIPEEEFENLDPEEREELEAYDFEPRCYSYQPNIFRSLVLGENIYSVSENGIQVNDFETAKNIEWIAFK